MAKISGKRVFIRNLAKTLVRTLVKALGKAFSKDPIRYLVRALRKILFVFPAEDRHWVHSEQMNTSCLPGSLKGYPGSSERLKKEVNLILK